MPRLNIFAAEEIRAFDKPPRFTPEQRQKYFELVPALQTLLQKLRTPTNKVGLTLHWGYFRATGRFFLPQDFRQTNLTHVTEILAISVASIDLHDYSQKMKISRDHEKIVLKAMQFRPFDQTDKTLLYERIEHLAKKHMSPQEMLYFLASQLHQQKTEIPGYYTFNEAMSKIYNQVEEKLLHVVEKHITPEQKISFLQLIETNNQTQAIKLSRWKYINQSLQVKDIWASIMTFKEIKSIFYESLPLLNQLNLSSESTEYYATWLKKARLSQIRQFPNKNKYYLHSAAFIQHQFYLRQDTLIDILLKSVQSTHNQAIEKKGYKILPSRTINSNFIREQWDDFLRFMASIKLKEATASQLFKRLSSYAKDHPLYKAVKEFGRIIKTLYTLTYIDDVKLRQQIEKQLNRVELSNKFAKAVFFDKDHEFSVATKEEQEITVACKTLVQNAIVLWNYLYISQLIANTSNVQDKTRLFNTVKQGSLIAWVTSICGESMILQGVSKNPRLIWEKFYRCRYRKDSFDRQTLIPVPLCNGTQR